MTKDDRYTIITSENNSGNSHIMISWGVGVMSIKYYTKHGKNTTYILNLIHNLIMRTYMEKRCGYKNTAL